MHYRGMRIFLSALLFLFILMGAVFPVRASQEEAKTKGAITREDIRGNFSFMWAPHVQTKGLPPCLELDYIDGVTLIMQWRNIEPRRGEYQWELIDTVLREAEKHGKIVNLGFFPGEKSPDYVLAEVKDWFVPSSQTTHGGEPGGKVIHAPLPWDEAYNRLWLDFIRVVSARYGKHPNIGFLQICGPAPTAMEMSLRLPKDRFQSLRDQGYTAKRYTEQWKKTIDAFAEIWPDKPLAITLGPVISDSGEQQTAETALAVADYMQQRLGQRAMIKVAFLNGTWWKSQKEGDHAKPIIDSIRALSAKTWTGGEMFWSSRDKNEKVNGPLRVALQNGLDAGMKWLDIYQQDIADYADKQIYAPYVEDLKYSHQQLRGSAGQ